MNPANDRLKGTVNSAVGRFENIKGKTKSAAGAIREKFQDVSYKVGNKIEHVGRDAQDKGYTKTVHAVENGRSTDFLSASTLSCLFLMR